MKRKWTDRSRGEARDRCRRLRWHEYESGPDGKGIVPVRKSIHLVLGGAVHSGLEVLLREGQEYLNERSELSLQESLEMLFSVTSPAGPKTRARCIENQAVATALADLSEMMGTAGVELDILEQQGTAQVIAEVGAKKDVVAGDMLSVEGLGLETESPITITFEDFADPIVKSDYDNMVASLSPETQSTLSNDITLDQSDGMDKYLREEMGALVEAMVRAYSRRRWRPLLEQFEVLEVEREGWWKLGGWSKCENCGRDPGYLTEGACLSCASGGHAALYEATELFFMSRHDGLLLDRQTGSLYLLSYKTTSGWDRRKEMDAAVNQQGLSEAVDVEKRLREAWQLIQTTITNATYEDGRFKGEWPDETDLKDTQGINKRIMELVSPRIASWLSTLSEPPRILGVRYEYLLKGARRQDKKDPELPGRYVADTPLVRAWRQDGITSEDRSWAWTYDWYDIVGKDGSKHTLSYRSWQKSPVWKWMPIVQWIDMLDKGDVQPDAYGPEGVPYDALGEQFIPPITVYRNEDDMRDWLEQTEASEVKIAQDADLVRRAKAEGGEDAERSALNVLFSQSRNHCIYPGLCAYYKICYGGQDIRRDPLASGHYVPRVVNHPVEMTDEKEEL